MSARHFFAGSHPRSVVGAAFIMPAFRVKPRWQKRPGGRDECCPYHGSLIRTCCKKM